MIITTRNTIRAGVLLLLVFAAGSAWANSKFLNVQGKLTDTAGSPLTGNQTVTFRIYTSSTVAVASATWTESQTIVLSSGLFNVRLGTVTTMDSIAFNQQYYLGIQVAGDANELSPRQPLGASAYALGSLGDFNAGNNLVVGSSITVGANLIANSSVTIGGALSVGSSISAISLAVTTITTSGNVSIGGAAVVTGSMTVQSNAFSVGGSTLAVNGGRIGISSTTPSYRLTVGGQVLDGIYLFRDDSPQINAHFYPDNRWSENGVSIDVAGYKAIFMSSSDGNVVVGEMIGGPTSATASTFTVTGSVSIGHAPWVPAPDEGLLVDGKVGIGSTNPSAKLHISSGTIRIDGTGAPSNGGALCLNSSRSLSKCTSAIDSSGNCTCP